MSDRASSQVSQWDSLTRAKRGSSLIDAAKKLRVMLQPIFEPVLFRRKSDENPGRATMPRDQNFFVDRQPQVLGEVILHLRQGHLSRSLRLACLVRRATIALRPS